MSAGALTINFDTDGSAKTIAFTDTAAVSLTNTTSGANKTLTLSPTVATTGLTTGTGAVSIGSATANQGVNIALGSNQTWTIGSGGLTVNNAVSGAFSLTSAGTGTLVLSGSSTYSGGTTIGGAGGSVIRATASDALGSGTVLILGNGQSNRLELTGNITLANAITQNGRSNTLATAAGFPASSMCPGTTPSQER
jgi:fibronectin-binding autotransporter adhesin